MRAIPIVGQGNKRFGIDETRASSKRRNRVYSEDQQAVKACCRNPSRRWYRCAWRCCGISRHGGLLSLSHYFNSVTTANGSCHRGTGLRCASQGPLSKYASVILKNFTKVWSIFAVNIEEALLVTMASKLLAWYSWSHQPPSHPQGPRIGPAAPPLRSGSCAIEGRSMASEVERLQSKVYPFSESVPSSRYTTTSQPS